MELGSTPLATKKTHVSEAVLAVDTEVEGRGEVGTKQKSGTAPEAAMAVGACGLNATTGTKRIFFINRKKALLNRVNPDTGKLYTEAEADQKAFQDFSKGVGISLQENIHPWPL